MQKAIPRESLFKPPRRHLQPKKEHWQKFYSGGGFEENPPPLCAPLRPALAGKALIPGWWAPAGSPAILQTNCKLFILLVVHFTLIAAYFKLIADYCRLLVDYFILIPDYCRLIADYFKLLVNYSILIVDYCRLSADYCRLIADYSQTI